MFTIFLTLNILFTIEPFGVPWLYHFLSGMTFFFFSCWGISNCYIICVSFYLYHFQLKCKLFKTCKPQDNHLSFPLFPVGHPWQSLHPTAPTWTGCVPCLIQGFFSEISLHHLLGHLFLSRIPVFWFRCWLLSWFTLLFKSTSSHNILANSAFKINFLSPYMCSKNYQVWGVKLSLSGYRILDWNSLFLFGITPLVYLSDSSPYGNDWFSSHISKMPLGSSYP